MNFHRVTLPKKLENLRSLDRSGLQSCEIYQADIIEVNFANMISARPFPMLYVMNRIRSLSAKEDVQIRPVFSKRNTKFSKFSKTIGWFKEMGLDEAQPTTYEDENVVALRMKSWNIQDFIDEAGPTPIGELVRERAGWFAEVLSRKSHGELYLTIRYAIQELFRNSFEHSDGKSVTLFACYYKKKHKAEIAVIDDGIGIFQSLMKNKKLDAPPKDNFAAIKIALHPGISKISMEDMGDEHFSNSGFGLFITSRLAKKFGEFHIISNNDYLLLKTGRQIPNEYPLKGTSVALSLDLEYSGEVAREITDLVDEGNRQVSELTGGKLPNASTASKSLHDDFPKKIPIR